MEVPGTITRVCIKIRARNLACGLFVYWKIGNDPMSVLVGDHTRPVPIQTATKVKIFWSVYMRLTGMKLKPCSCKYFWPHPEFSIIPVTMLFLFVTLMAGPVWTHSCRSCIRNEWDRPKLSFRTGFMLTKTRICMGCNLKSCPSDFELVLCNQLLRPRSHDAGKKWNRNKIITVRLCVHTQGLTWNAHKTWNRNANCNDLKP